jgi:MFS family permease/tetratricopeptide (TPR) repeat protein
VVPRCDAAPIVHTAPTADPGHSALLARAEAAALAVAVSPVDARDDAEQVASEAKATGATEALVVALTAVGDACRTSYDHDAAQEALTAAIRAAARSGLAAREAAARIVRSAAHLELGNRTRAANDLRAAARLLGTKPTASLLFAQGLLADAAGNLADADRHYLAAAAHDDADHRLAAKALNNAGITALLRGDADSADRSLQRALHHADRAGDSLAGVVAHNLGWAAARRGRLADSLRRYEEAGERLRVAGMPMAEHHLGMLDVFTQLRLLPEAADAAARAAQELDRPGGALVRADALLAGAAVLLESGAVDDARRDVDAAAALATGQRRPGTVDRAALLRARCVLAAPDAPTTGDLDALLDATRRLQRRHDRQHAREGFSIAVALAVRLGDHRRARAALRSLEALATDAGVLDRLAMHHAAASVAAVAGEGEAALAHCRDGLAELDDLRLALPSAELRARASGHGRHLAGLALGLVAPAADPVTVLAWIERARSVALQASASAGSDHLPAAAARVVEDLRSVNAALALLPAEADDEARRLVTRQRALEQRLRRWSWRNTPAGRGAAAGTFEMERLRRALDTRVLVELAVVGDRIVSVVVPGVGCDAQPHVHRHPMGSSHEATDATEQVHAALRATLRTGTTGARGRRLSAAIERLDATVAAPLSRLLQHASEIVVVPPAGLQAVPWASLPSLDLAPVWVAPSAATFVRCAEQPPAPATQVLVAAGPALEHAEREVREISGIYGPDACTTIRPRRATCAAVLDALQTADVAHLVCHGSFRADNPAFSALRFADGDVTAMDLATLTTAPAVVVLAACDAGVTAPLPGEEVLGLVPTLIAAGSRAVVAPLLPVPDLETAALMAAFHRALAGGATVAAALRTARRSAPADGPEPWPPPSRSPPSAAEPYGNLTFLTGRSVACALVPVAGFQPLRHRAYAITWSAGATSDMGTWVQLTTIGALVASTSGSALATAMVAAATFAPQGLASPLGGVLADRVDRRKLFLCTLASQTMVTAVIAAVLFAGVRDPLVLSGLVLLQSSSGALGSPGMQSMLPDLVPREELTAAVALGNLGWNMGRVLGPLIAALLLPIGAGWAITANAVSFAVLWLAMLSIRRPFLPAARVRSSVGSELAQGARALVRTRSVVITVGTLVLLNFCYIPFMGLMPATARSLLERSGRPLDESTVASVTSRLMSAQGIGAILGSVMLASLIIRFRRSMVITFALISVSVLLPLHVMVPSVPVTALVLAALGAVSAITFSSFMGVVQRDAPATERGRILAWQQGAIGLTYGLGLTVHGIVADRFGLQPLYIAGGLCTLAVVVAMRRAPQWADRMDGRLEATPGLTVQPSTAAATA